ncbi:MAG: hypothetical protein ACREUW_01320 [Burkholderiales bacterium]
MRTILIIAGLYPYPVKRCAGGVVFGRNVIALKGIGPTLRVGQALAEEWNS